MGTGSGFLTPTHFSRGDIGKRHSWDAKIWGEMECWVLYCTFYLSSLLYRKIFGWYTGVLIVIRWLIVIGLKLEIPCPISRRIDPCRYSILGIVVRHKREVKLLSTSLLFFSSPGSSGFFSESDVVCKYQWRVNFSVELLLSVNWDVIKLLYMNNIIYNIHRTLRSK